MPKSNEKMLQVKLVRSLIGSSEKQRLSVKALGLKKIGDTVRVQQHPALLGLVKKIHYLVSVEEV